MDILQKIAEHKIREAIENGEFDDLPSKGEPIKIEDFSGVPEHLRMGYKILKNAGVLPEEIQLKKEIISLQSLIDACYDEEEKVRMKSKLNEKILQFNMAMERNFHKPVYRKY